MPLSCVCVVSPTLRAVASVILKPKTGLTNTAEPVRVVSFARALCLVCVKTSSVVPVVRLRAALPPGPVGLCEVLRCADLAAPGVWTTGERGVGSGLSCT